MKLQVAGLENRPLADGELAPAMVTFPETGADVAFAILDALQPVDAIYSAAMRASRAFRPHDRFQGREGRCFVVKVFLVENACHFRLPLIV